MDITEDFIALRAAAIVRRRVQRDAAAEAEADVAWWPVSLLMFGLGLASGLSWWLIAQIPNFDPLPRILG